MDFGETRRHQEDKPLTGAAENMRRLGLIRPWDPSWCPVTLLAVSSHVLWIVGGRLPLRGYREPGPVRASVVLSQVLARSIGHTCRTLRGTGSVSNTILTIRNVPRWHVDGVPSAAEAAVRAVLAVHVSLGAAVQRRPRKYSDVTGASVAGRPVT